MIIDIKEYKFAVPFPSEEQKNLLSERKGENWPVVYLLTGDEELYVGETSSAIRRMIQHGNPSAKSARDREKLNCVEIIFDPYFNKSAVLDIEQTLISMFHFEIHEKKKNDKKKSDRFKYLQNRNQGQSKMHNYFNRAFYQDKIKDIWNELQKKGIAKNKYEDIVNDAIFKFSPYKTLNEGQKRISIEIINKILDALEKKEPYTAIVKGEAGSGKTIVLLNMMFTIADALKTNMQAFLSPDEFDEEDELLDLSEDIKLIQRIINYKEKHGKPRIAYVAQMLSLRNTIGDVFKNSRHFYKKYSMGPSDVAKVYSQDNYEPFDILFIDEAHRLERRQNISNIGAFDKTCRRLYGPNIDCNNYTKLDWLIKCSKTQVIVYDEVQSVKASDIDSQQFYSAIKSHGGNYDEFFLRNQMRCRAGDEYVSYLDSIFNCTISTPPTQFLGFELRVIDDGNELINTICQLDKEFGLCKVVTGPHWQWNMKKYKKYISQFQTLNRGKSKEDQREDQIDYLLNHLEGTEGIVDLNGIQYVRNMDFDWILKGNPKEIGCIHTCQGYDLNYVGVIFSPEIDYEPSLNEIVINKSLVDDHSVRVQVTGKMKDYIINSYKVMMSRGIRGCYVYACNENLQKYLKEVFPKDNH